MWSIEQEIFGKVFILNSSNDMFKKLTIRKIKAYFKVFIPYK